MDTWRDVWRALGNLLTTKTKGVSLSGSRTTHENNVNYEHWCSVWLHRKKPTTMLQRAKQRLHHEVTSHKLTTHEVTVHVSSRSIVFSLLGGRALAYFTQSEATLTCRETEFSCRKKLKIKQEVTGNTWAWKGFFNIHQPLCSCL